MNPSFRPVRFAMVGGGGAAFIGPVHRMAAELDCKLRLVAGAFSRDLDCSISAGRKWGVEAARCHDDFEAMIAAESSRADGAELVVIATPNASHYRIAKSALAAGLSVVSEKPATATLAEALELREAVAASPGIYALTFTYTGYPLVREARRLIACGAVGRVRKVIVDYSQGWLTQAIEADGANRQAAWRTDPSQSGAGGCIADIGVHAFNLAEFVSGERVADLCADLSAMVPGRALDDDCNLLLRFANGASGMLHASQVAAGDRNDLTLRIWGETGGLTWRHSTSETLMLERPGEPSQVWHAGESYLRGAAARLPAGHPQGFIEAFANIYCDVADAVRKGELPELVPGIDDGVRSMTFVETAIESSRRRGWTKMEGSGA